MQARTGLRVSLVLGSDPDVDRDGVGQYTERLHEYISANIAENRVRDLSIDLVRLRPRSLREWKSQLEDIFGHCDLVHVEYPYEGWGTSPVPGVYPGLLKSVPRYRNVKLVTTFHEWRSMHPLRKSSVVPLALTSDGLLFVSNREHGAFKDGLCYGLRLRKPVTDVVPIGVNIAMPELQAQEILDVRAQLLYWGGVTVDVLLGYFGFIYASKQPDNMLRTLQVLLERGVRTRLVIAGDFPADHAGQKKTFLQRVRRLGLEDYVTYLGFVTDERVLAQTLSACNVALLLFSDGVSARRGSFWTLLELGVPIITTKPAFDKEFDNLLPQHFYENLRFVASREEPERLAASARQFARFSIPQQKRGVSPDWNLIASKHVNFYQKILEGA